MRKIIVPIILLICMCITFMLFTACAVPDKKRHKESNSVVVFSDSISPNRKSQETPRKESASSNSEKDSANLSNGNSRVIINDEDSQSVQTGDSVINDNTAEGIIYLPEVP